MLQTNDNSYFKRFANVVDAQNYAKLHPGVTVKRSGDKFLVFGEVQRAVKVNPQFSPQTILEHLNTHVIGQDEAKYEIAQTLYYHSMKAKHPKNEKLTKSLPVMLVGSTGSGKTFIMQKACEAVDMLFLHVSCANMVPDGIKGYSVDNIGQELIKLSKGSLSKLHHAIVFLDEIDKLYLPSNGDAEFGAQIGAQLLRILEGGSLNVYVDGDNISVNTTNMLFLLGGAFQSILDEKYAQKSSVGFLDNTKDSVKEITLDDLYAYGVPKELLGRVGSVINLKKLTPDDYIHILTKSQSSPLKEFTDKIEFHGNSVHISQELIDTIALQAYRHDLGARGLRQILKPYFKTALFESPSVRGKNFIIS